MRLGLNTLNVRWAALLAVPLLAGMAARAQQFSSFIASAPSTIGDDATGTGIFAAGGSSSAAGDGRIMNRFEMRAKGMPFEYGAVVQGGLGLTEERSDFKFIMAGVHVGKVLYRHDKPGLLDGNFELAAELFPYWQSFTPKFDRAHCVAGPLLGGVSCGPLYPTGGTYTGVTVTPVIFRWNFANHGRITPWAQAAGGLLWTNHKYPAFGSSTLTVGEDGPNTEASVWNFTPQGGVGLHYFLSPRRSIDFGANAVHISSASLGDKNPGVNASLQFTVGYTFWK